MTNKDYEVLASILYSHRQTMSKIRKKETMEHACILLKKDNPNFDEERFRRACDYPEWFMNKTLRDP